MKIDFLNKVVVITGGINGIGKEISNQFINLNAKVAILDISLTSENTYNESNNEKILMLKTDISNHSEVENSIKQIIRHFGKIDFLINNAGITKDSLLMRMSIQNWNRVIEVNLTGVFNVTKFVIANMLKNKYGRIINISSIVGIIGNAGQVNYSSSKAGLIGFTKSVAREFASKNINCNAIAPGYISTGMTDNLSDIIKQKLISIIPLKRIGVCNDVIGMICFLCSKYTDYITGQVINIDGGIVI